MKLDKNNMAHRNVWCTTYDDGSLYEDGIYHSRREAREAAAKHNAEIKESPLYVRRCLILYVVQKP